MNLKLENARYTNVHGTLDDKRYGTKMFDIDVTDLDGVINGGKTFPYTYLDNEFDSDDKIKPVIKSTLSELSITNGLLSPDPIASLTLYKRGVQKDIDEDFKLYITKYDGIFFDSDLFPYDQDSINVLNSIIACYDSQLSNDTLSTDKISHRFISSTNIIHELTYAKLVELHNLMVLRYSEIKLHARELKDKIENAETVEEVKAVVWDLWDI
jgi:hypothetical protein